MKTGTYIDARHSMYPCQSWLLSKPVKDHITVPPYCTLYGFVVSGHADRAASIIEGAAGADGPRVLRQAGQGQYFCHATGSETATLVLDDEGDVQVFAVIRHGFRGQGLVGGPIEASGRLCYIDNCSDSLLVYPPRKGDPSLNHLSFPAGVRQSFHIHPSIRLGVVANGSGFACFAVLHRGARAASLPHGRSAARCHRVPPGRRLGADRSGSPDAQPHVSVGGAS
jgi:hypothetical protein